ncbi:MAG: outer membrane beta-barrel protein [Desulfobacterales bacterium]
MKKGFAILCGLGILALASTPLYAGGIINKQNQSADYIRTLNRHAATDYADIAVYNPAGIMKMDNGGYAKLDVMYFAKDYSDTVPGFGELSQDDPSIIPGLFAIYKQDRWAGFFTFTIPAGGGELDYKDGSARTVALAQGVAAGANARLGAAGVPSTFFYNQIGDMSLHIKESTVYGFTLGGSFAATEMLSFAAGIRYSTGTREFDGQATISAANALPGGLNGPITPSLNLSEDADGWCGILGVNFAPTDKLNTALTFVSNTKMEYEMDVKRDTLGIAPSLGYPDGSKRRIDIPGLLGFGISYKFLPQLKVDLNYVYYLESSAEIDTFDDYGDSWDLGLSVEYTFSPQWKASVGYLHTDIKLDDDQQINEPEEPKLDANTFGIGAVWSPTPAWDITFGGLYADYKDVTDQLGINYDKSVWSLAAGVQWKFF